ncbi:MAG: tetratricopeptide repeat protein [Bacteroidota bacterium]|nr:tetratricopeptide repeat protein [Bacteroidota bacterium]
MKIRLLIISLFILSALLLEGQNNSNILRQRDNAPQRDQDEILAMQYYRDQNFEKAVVLFEELYEKKSGVRYYSYYLKCLIETRDFKTAERIAKRNARRNPDYYKYYIDLGYIYSLQDELEKANEEYRKVISNLPDNENLIRSIASSFAVRGQTQLAIETLEKGKELVSKKYAFNMDLANNYYRLGNFEKMVEEYLEYLRYDESALSRIQSRMQFMLDGLAAESIRESLKRGLLKRNQEYPDLRQYAEMLYWLSLQEKDFEFALIQAKAIDRRFGENGLRLLDLAQISLENEAYATAIEAFEYIIKRGPDNPYYLKARTGLLRTKFEKITSGREHSEKQFQQLEKDYEKSLDEIGRNAYTVMLVRDYAHLLAFYLGKLESAAEVLDGAIRIPGASTADVAECKLELGDVYLFQDQVWEATLLYSQVDKEFKNDPLGHEAKLRNAKLFYYIGEFEWARTQLDILKAATSKLIANDALELSLIIQDNTNYDSTTAELGVYAAADLLFYQNKDERALRLLDSLQLITGMHPIKDELLFKKAQIYESRAEYNTADSLYASVLQVNPYENIKADNALFARARLQEEHFMDKAKAIEIYRQLLLDYPGSIFTAEARKRLRMLRGDEI